MSYLPILIQRVNHRAAYATRTPGISTLGMIRYDAELGPTPNVGHVTSRGFVPQALDAVSVLTGFVRS